MTFLAPTGPVTRRENREVYHDPQHDLTTAISGRIPKDWTRWGSDSDDHPLPYVNAGRYEMAILSGFVAVRGVGFLESLT
jgi:hypothetical protein